MANLRENMIVYRKNRLEELAKRTDFKYVDLNNEQEEKLLDTILNMSIDRQNLIIFKNYYNHSFEEIEDILDIQNAKGEYLNLVGVLSGILDLDNEMISDNTMKKISTISARKINKETNKEFERDLKRRDNVRKILKFSSVLSNKAAVIFISFLIGFSVLVGANAYAEGRIFEWIVKTFEEYTSFNIAEENIVNKEDVSIKIGYIPEGFELKKKTLSNSSDIYYYKNKNKLLIINFLYDNVNTGLNTENVVQKEFELDDMKVITWEKENINYFVLNIKGVGCLIYGNISREEFIKIYNDISLN